MDAKDSDSDSDDSDLNSDAGTEPLDDDFTEERGFWTLDFSTVGGGILVSAQPILHIVLLHNNKNKSHADIIKEVWLLCRTLSEAEETISAQADELLTAHGHCTMACKDLATVRTQLKNIHKKCSYRSTKNKARALTLPEMKAEFDWSKLKWLEKEVEDKEIQAKKAVTSANLQHQMLQDIVLKTFEKPLSTYKKYDFMVIAGALKLDTVGTVAVLQEKIKTHLATHPDLKSNPQFSSLFHLSCQQNMASNITATASGPQPE